MSEYLVSLCIPTYNRAKILSNTLYKIVSNSAFDKSIEIVISDNASTDNTEEICKEYVDKYSNVKYYKNEKNVFDKNFYIALTRGNGEYLKLLNDYTYFTENGLDILKQTLTKYPNEAVFFYNKDLLLRNQNDVIFCKNLDDFISVVSNSVTFISYFGLPRKLLSCISYSNTNNNLKLLQVDWSYNVVLNSKRTIVIPTQIFEFIKHDNKGNYNWVEIHINNYCNILRSFLTKGLISRETYNKDLNNTIKHLRKTLFYTFVYSPPYFSYKKKGSFKYLYKNCRYAWRFWFYFLCYPIFLLLYPICVVVFGIPGLWELIKKIIGRK